ncbi:MAG: gamma-glutamyltransferase [Bdellovibrionales bacterium]|nr:gamma-glutamyltransferase [Bdellovibrionales bacterium]
MKQFPQFAIAIFLLLFQICAGAIPSQGHRVMIAAPTERGVDVGQKIAAKGGNVVDIAVAVQLALGVTSPYYASLGGGAFAMIRMGNATPEALDFREVAPIMTHQTFYKDKDDKAPIIGPLAIGVPGIAAGLFEMHRKYGKLKWSQLFEEAIRLANEGFPVSGEWVKLTNGSKKDFNPAGLKYFFKSNGDSYKPGEILKQPQLGNALKLLRDKGPKAFYEGEIGKDIEQTIKGKGVLAMSDLKNYKTRWLNPLQKDYNGYSVYMMPPPSSSGVVTSSLITLMQQLQMDKQVPLSVEEYHLIGEMFKVAFRGRTQLGDPEFTQNPISMLTGDDYLKPLGAKIKNNKVLSLAPLDDQNEPKESKETTNFTVMDADGNTVVLTSTLNGNYGSRVVSNKYGIAMNNEMDDFTTVLGRPNMFGLVQGRANLVQAGKRPLSSMSPTIITKDNKTVMGVGASGGPTIITSVFQTWYRVLVSKLDIDRAMQAPRVHQQFAPNILFLDYNNFPADTKKGLEKIGHKVDNGSTGKVNGIFLNDQGILEAAFDSRGEGGAGGI